jgi:hypothetical protein
LSQPELEEAFLLLRKAREDAEAVRKFCADADTALYDIRELGPWAVEFRYGETIDDPLDRERASTLVAEVIGWAETHINARADT